MRLKFINKMIILLFCLGTSIAIGQTKLENYRFSADILSQIAKDTVAWKYQTGATELSFGGYYSEVLKMWDLNRVNKPKITKEDSLYFKNSTKINAKEYIIQQARNSEIVIINEAHHMAQHRTFTKSLLKDLYNQGYRYLGLEALFDLQINERKFPTLESGYYTKEPEFGNLLYEALHIGYTLFGYEAPAGYNGKEREIAQATNIQKFMDSVPEGKVLIYCGYAHAFENDYPAWGKAMAGRLKELINKDPFTIDQSMFIERASDEYTHLYIKLNNLKQPLLLRGKYGHVFNGKGEVKQTDVVIIHPPTTYVNNRPDWLIVGKKKHNISSKKIKNDEKYLALAYRNNEFEKEGIPADIIEFTNKNTLKALYLNNGLYTVVIKDKNYQIVDQYKVQIK